MTFPRLTKPLPIVTLLVVLGVVAASAAPVVWHWRGDFAGQPAAQTITPTAQVADLKAPADIGPILTLAPFGMPPEAPIADTPIGETTLDLTLLGVVVRSDPALSRALIANAGTSGQYGPGDQITDRAKLASVAADHVVLDVDGTYQTLSFPVPGDASPAQPAVVTGTDRLLAAVTAQTAEPVPETTADYIDLWRERIIANPGEVMSAIGLIPTPDGYVIAEQHDSGVELAGLRAGDLVTSVNGQAVGNVERDRQLYDDVAASGMARIEIERDGRTIVMSFPLQ
jgi:general secretion pathway protein C